MKWFDTIRNGVIKALDKTGKMKVRGLPRALVILLMVLILLVIVLYIAGWVFVWYYSGKVEFIALNELLRTITGTAFIAAVGFLAKALIDEDENGIPDYLEKEEKNETSNAERHRDDG
jgi:RsiW-degrading membrane proteinase PrsW (M82 family)|nr:MAG TPA: hypothetical protein [Caudoviricetes sp.]